MISVFKYFCYFFKVCVAAAVVVSFIIWFNIKYVVLEVSFKIMVLWDCLNCCKIVDCYKENG